VVADVLLVLAVSNLFDGMQQVFPPSSDAISRPISA
jgi:hypothetical protein